MTFPKLYGIIKTIHSMSTGSFSAGETPVNVRFETIVVDYLLQGRQGWAMAEMHSAGTSARNYEFL